MIAIDTNVLLRYVVDTADEDQVAQARAFVARECSPTAPALIVDIVLCEFVWVMRKTLRFQKADIVAALECLVIDSLIQFQDREIVLGAVQSYIEGDADLADHLLAANALKSGSVEVVTFDEAASKQSPFRLIGT
jgi:predicted nucleic-acid-binding protein